MIEWARMMKNWICIYCCKNACWIVIANHSGASVFHVHLACFDIFNSHFPAVLCCPFENFLLLYSLYHLFFFIACSMFKTMNVSNERTHKMRFFSQYFPYALHYLLAEWFFAVAYIWFAFMINHRQHNVKILLISVGPDIAVSHFSTRMLNIWWWLLFIFFDKCNSTSSLASP